MRGSGLKETRALLRMIRKPLGAQSPSRMRGSAMRAAISTPCAMRMQLLEALEKLDCRAAYAGR